MQLVSQTMKRILLYYTYIFNGEIAKDSCFHLSEMMCLVTREVMISQFFG